MKKNKTGNGAFGTKTLFLAGMAVLALALAVSLTGCQMEEDPDPDPVPPELQGKWYKTTGEADTGVQTSNLMVTFTGTRYSLGILGYNVSSVRDGRIHFENNSGESQGYITYSLEGDGGYKKLSLYEIDQYTGILAIPSPLYRK